MLTTIVCTVIYLAVAYATFQYNAYLVRTEPMVRGHIVLRNALLWPVFLPLLIYNHTRN